MSSREKHLLSRGKNTHSLRKSKKKLSVQNTEKCPHPAKYVRGMEEM
jgi:hypothetical protein